MAQKASPARSQDARDACRRTSRVLSIAMTEADTFWLMEEARLRASSSSSAVRVATDSSSPGTVTLDELRERNAGDDIVLGGGRRGMCLGTLEARPILETVPVEGKGYVTTCRRGGSTMPGAVL